MYVQESEAAKRKPNRIAQYTREKQAAVTGLVKSPFIEISWNEKGRRMKKQRALIDTGADWSLLREDQLSEDELEGLQGTDVVGHGVSNEEIPVIGQIWRDIVIGGVTVPGQCFIVVKDMVTKVIVGSDFWARLSTITLDFQKKQLMIPDLGIDVPMFETEEEVPDDENEAVDLMLRVCEKVRIPAMTEMFVECHAEAAEEDVEYLVEPLDNNEGGSVNAAFCLVRPHEKRCYVRIANVSTKAEHLHAGSVIATLQHKIAAVNLNSGRAFKSPSIQFDWEVRMGGSLDNGQRHELGQLLMEMKGVFYDGGQLPVVRVGVEHEIHIEKGAAPKANRPRRLSPDLEQEVRSEIEELLRIGVIRRSNSPWAAPIVCARRQNGTLRLALDYRGPNSISHPATLHPIPRIDDLLDRLGEARYFSTLDAKSGYHQLPLKEHDSEVTAFVVPWGQFEFAERTPFGLKGAGYSFQRMMAVILSDSNYDEALCYLDDILIWGTTWNEHMRRLKVVLMKILKAGLALSFEKCLFGVQEVQYLGAVIHNGMLKMSEQRVKDLRSIQRPTTVTELRKAIGAFAYVQQWIPGLADIAKPLYNLAKGRRRSVLEWESEHEQAFEELKRRVANAVALKIPNMKEKFTLVTDASTIAIGSMLAQRSKSNPSLLVPIAFYHHALSKAEQNYNTTERELLAVVLSVKRFSVYLSNPFDVITDHRALRWLNTLDIHDQKGRKGRWIEYLQEFDLTPIHKSGKSETMSIADYLSRVCSNGQCSPQINAPVQSGDSRSQVVTTMFDIEVVKDRQQQDPVLMKWIAMITDTKSNNDTQSGSKESSSTPREVERMFVDKRGILCLRFNGSQRSPRHPAGRKEYNRIVLPESLKAEALSLLHDSPLAGHMGQRRTWQKARDVFWWPNMKQDVMEYVRGCDRCSMNKYNLKPNRAPIQETDIPAKPMEALQVDFLGPFPRSDVHPYQYILQIQDVLSRYVRFIPTIRSDAVTAAETLFEEWICVFGYPLDIGSDRGKHFASEVFRTVCSLGGINHHMGASYHPQSQGQVERQNQLLVQVRCLCNNGVDDWPEALVRIQLSHNMSVNETTGYSPIELITGHPPRAVEKLLVENESSTCKRPENYILEKEARLQKLIKHATENIVSAQKSRNGKHKVRGIPYKVGDLVRIQFGTADRGSRGGQKLAPLFSKTYSVREVLAGGWTYWLTPYKRKGRDKIRHFDQLITAYLRSLEDGVTNRTRVSESDVSEEELMSEEESSAQSTDSERVPDDHDMGDQSDIGEQMDTSEQNKNSPQGRPRRERRPPSRFQAKWGTKHHSESRVHYTASSTDEESDANPDSQ